MILQLSVFMQNEKGRMAEACRTIAEAGIDIHALFVADTEQFGVLRALCDTPATAAERMQQAGWRATVTPVLGVRVNDVPGGLSALLTFLDERDVNVEYGYCVSLEDGSAVNILKTDGDKALEAVLAEAGFTIARPKDLYSID